MSKNDRGNGVKQLAEIANASQQCFVNTPYYVLKSGNQPIYPTIGFDDPDTSCRCVYGFSDKRLYDKFIKDADQLLTPYPLVKGYLTKMLDDQDSSDSKRVCPGYVILDAASGGQPVLAAATIAAVLLAHQEKSKKVPIEVELVFDQGTASFHVEPKHIEQ